MLEATLKSKYKNPKYIKRTKRFARFARTFVNSAPSKIARVRDRKLSTKNPFKYLRLANRPISPKPPTPPPELPEEIKELLKLQTDDGTWHPSPVITWCLGGVVPSTPHDIDAVRWTTALVLVFYKRHPDLWTHLRESYDDGFRFVDDPRLLRTAAKALPPAFVGQRCNFLQNLDAGLVDRGKWKRATKRAMSTTGYRAFVDPLPPRDSLAQTIQSFNDTKALKEPLSARSEEEEEIPEPVVSEDPAVVTAAREEGRWSAFRLQLPDGEFVPFIASQLIDFQSPKPQLFQSSVVFSSEGQIVPGVRSWEFLAPASEGGGQWTVGVDLQAQELDEGNLSVREGEKMSYEVRQILKDLPTPSAHDRACYANELRHYLRHRPCPYQEGESVQVCWRRPDRFSEPAKTKVWFAAAILRENADGLSVGVRYEDNGEVDLRVPRRHCRPLTRHTADGAEPPNHWRGERTFVGRLQRKWEKLIFPKKEAARVKKYHDPTMGRTWNASTRKKTRKSPKRRRKKPKMLTPRMEVHENEAVKGLQMEAMQNIMRHEQLLASARALLPGTSERYDVAALAEDKLQVFNEFTKLLERIREVVTEVVESIVLWQEAKHALMPPVKLGYQQKPSLPMFIWNGTDYLLTIARSLDFLGTSKQLRHCYGEDFPCQLNPFSLHTTLTQRPKSPRAGTFMVLVNNRPVRRQSVSEMKKRQAEEGVMNKWRQQLVNTPMWWPRIYGRDHEIFLPRVRAAEKVVATTYINSL